jgi:predicted RNA-binding protein with PIN domain
MPYLIDGHNLIPKVPGMSLRVIDDEDRLIAALQVFYRVRRQGVEVFFDQAPPTRGGRKTSGSVVVHYVRQGKTADQAILDRLQQLGKAARNWTVVTSDRQVRAGAHEHGASLLTSEEFSAQLQAAHQVAQTIQKENPDSAPSPDEVEEWLRLFRDRKNL